MTFAKNSNLWCIDAVIHNMRTANNCPFTGMQCYMSCAAPVHMYTQKCNRAGMICLVQQTLPLCRPIHPGSSWLGLLFVTRTPREGTVLPAGRSLVPCPALMLLALKAQLPPSSLLYQDSHPGSQTLACLAAHDSAAETGLWSQH